MSFLEPVIDYGAFLRVFPIVTAAIAMAVALYVRRIGKRLDAEADRRATT